MHQFPKDIGWIEVICGSMFSGKTEELIRRLKRAEIARQKVQIFKPKIDNRYSELAVVSHSQLKIIATPIVRADEIIQNLRAELATMADSLAQVSAELDAYKLAQDGEAAAKEILILQRKLELATQARDQYMTTCGELRKEVAALKRKLGK